MTRSLLVLAAMASSAAADPKPGPSVQELVAWVDAKLAPIQTLELVLETHVPAPPEGDVLPTLTRTDVLQLARKGDRMRFESTGVTTYACKRKGCRRPMPEPPVTLIVLANGADQLQYFAGSRSAHRSKARTQPSTLKITSWLRGTKLTRADAEGAYVLEATEGTTVTTVFLSPATGLPVKQVVKTPAGSLTTITKQVAIDKPLADDRFALPAGVTVDPAR